MVNSVVHFGNTGVRLLVLKLSIHLDCHLAKSRLPALAAALCAIVEILLPPRPEAVHRIYPLYSNPFNRYADRRVTRFIDCNALENESGVNVFGYFTSVWRC